MTPAPYSAIVTVYLPALALSVGFAQVEGLWQEPAGVAVRRRRWTTQRAVPVSWKPALAVYVPWDPVKPGRS